MQLSRSLILEVHLVPHGRAIHYGTNLPIRNVRFHGESWRVSGRWAGLKVTPPFLSSCRNVPYLVPPSEAINLK